MLGHCPDNLDDYVYFSQLNLYCAKQEYNFMAQKNFYLYCCCGYIATYTNMGRNCNACMFLKDINALDSFPRKTLKQYFNFFGTYTKLGMYWQSFLF